MDIGRPTNVRHVAHVTFDRFNGFLGLPSEFEPDVPRKAPSASKTVFGVSTESMQLSYDSRGNCVPVILLLMQSRLYDEGGLQAEGIFRITADNSEEEHVREQLNKGIIPDGIDVHCLAGLIKAWFRELPRGVLDPLPTEEMMQCESEDDFVKLVRLLPQSEASLLNWAVNLMADVVQYEHINKMNSRNIALIFAPNMSQMADPLTALMYAVQVMNLLKTLVEKTIRDRGTVSSRVDPPDDSNYDSAADSVDTEEEEEGEVEEEECNDQTDVNQPDRTETRQLNGSDLKGDSLRKPRLQPPELPSPAIFYFRGAFGFESSSDHAEDMKIETHKEKGEYVEVKETYLQKECVDGDMVRMGRLTGEGKQFSPPVSCIGKVCDEGDSGANAGGLRARREGGRLMLRFVQVDDEMFEEHGGKGETDDEDEDDEDGERSRVPKKNVIREDE